MIIRRLEAENLLKYKRLFLNNLPKRGVIALSGDNETGKSAIGEIVCFALFGRTYSLGPDGLSKLIRWGGVQGLVTLRFCIGDRDYEVIRHLDRDGEQSARLLAADEPGEPLARGVRAVRERLEQMLGYDFDQYVETFYLAQREITTPHPHSRAVKSMAGISPLERCADELRREIDLEQESICSLEGRQAEVADQLALLGPDHVRIAELERGLQNLSQRRQELVERIDQLRAAAGAYGDARRGLRSHSFRHWLAKSLMILALMMTAVVVGVGALLHFGPQLWPFPMLRGRLQETLTAAGIPLESALVYIGVAFGGMLVLNWLWILALNLGTRMRRARGRRLADELQRIDELEPADIEIAPEIPEEVLAAGEAPLETPALADRPDSERRTRLARRALALEASQEDVSAAVQHETAWMERRHEVFSDQCRTLQKKLGNARADHDKAREYAGTRDHLSSQLEEKRRRIGTRLLARDLLDGAVARMSIRFSDQLRGLVTKTLPQFTDGRYGHLQVDDDLRVRVYSNDKRSFLDVEEISSGTQRQTMLALRLALAQELVARVVKDAQFAFLDEPFAFFDNTRLRGAIQVLPDLGRDITQYWVAAQRFPKDVAIALEIPCGGHPDTLEIGRPARAEPGRTG